MVRWRVPAAVVCVAAGTALLFWTTSCSKPLTEAQESGKALYELNCYECHEENQLGLKKVPPKLHSIFSHHYLSDGSTPATDAEVRQVVIYGKGTMPAFNGRLSEAQIADLIAYLHRK
ncbi:MAG TPA: cytochrome c [Acidobacteriaceae bacterium]|nr:cytochrome c [Acidobacteriaceae bacterium]